MFLLLVLSFFSLHCLQANALALSGFASDLVSSCSVCALRVLRDCDFELHMDMLLCEEAERSAEAAAGVSSCSGCTRDFSASCPVVRLSM